MRPFSIKSTTALHHGHDSRIPAYRFRRCPFFGLTGSPAKESGNRKGDTACLVVVSKECMSAGERNMGIFGHLPAVAVGKYSAMLSGRTAALSPAFATAYARNIVINNTPGE